MARAQERAVCFNHPTSDMVELAEYVTELIDGMQWAVFGVNGSDMTTYALQVARRATGRKKVLIATAAYHGWHAWCSPGHGGIIDEDVRHIHRFTWNDGQSVRDQFARYPGQIAAVMVTPYHHPAFADSQLPENGFLEELCGLAKVNGTVVISDDVRVAFRASTNGSHTAFGFDPDLVCLSKAIANGYPISMCLGRDALKDAASGPYCTDTF